MSDAPARRAVVVGGGLAGIAAACGLVEAGWRVTLCESRPFLGGRVYSVPVGPDAPGVDVDNGQHVFLRCCTRFRALVERLGGSGDVALQDRVDVTLCDPDGVPSRLRAWRLPAPLHLLPALLRFRALSLWERLGLLRAGRAIRRVSAAARAGLDGEDFAAWLTRHGQGPRAIARFWEPFVLATLNLPCREASAAQCLMVFQEGLLADAHAGEVGWASVGLSRLVADRALAWLAARGAEVRTRTKIAAVAVEDSRRGGEAERRRGREAERKRGGEAESPGVEVGCRTRGVQLDDGTVLPADAVVLAVPWDALAPLLPAPWAGHPFFAAPAALAPSSILNVHLCLDRAVTDRDFFALYDAPVHWVFNKGRILRRPELDGRYLACVTSAADVAARAPGDAVLSTALGCLRRALPAARDAAVVWSRVVVEPAATFAARPGTAALRRPAATPIGGLALAGAWTDTGWPATMEGAVRSGEAAAAAIGRTPA